MGSVYILELEINLKSGFLWELCDLLMDNSIENIQDSEPKYLGSNISSAAN